MKGTALLVLLIGVTLAQSYPPDAHTTRHYSRAPSASKAPTEPEPKTTRAPKYPTSPAPLKIDTTQGSTKLYSRRVSAEVTTIRSIPGRTSPVYKAVTSRNKRAAAGSPTPKSKNDEEFFMDINQYWETYYVLRERTLIDLLVYADRHREHNVAADIKSLYDSSSLPYSFDTVLDRYSDSSEVQNYVKEFRGAPHGTPSQFWLPWLLETFNSSSAKEQEAFMDKLGRAGSVYHFFDTFRSLENGYSDFDLIFNNWQDRALRPNSWRKLQKSWRALTFEDKTMVKTVMSKDIEKENCSDIWERLQNSQDMEDFALVIEVMDHRYVGKSCFIRYEIKGEPSQWSTVAPYMIEKQVAWNKASSLGGAELVELLKYASKYDTLLTDIHPLTQNYTSGDFFKKVDSLFFKYPGVKRILDLLIKSQNSNFEHILSMTKSFYSMTTIEKEDLLSEAFAYSDYFRYLTDIWFVKSVVPNLHLLDMLNADMKTDFLAKVVRVWGDLEKKEKSMAAKVVFNRASEAECKKVFKEKPIIVEMVKVLDSSGFVSCFQKYGLYYNFH